MQKTQNFSLNKPEATDPMRVSDFNENADKIDGLLNSLSTAMATRPKIVTGSYVGTGTYGASNPNKLDFTDSLGKAPLFLYVTVSNGSGWLALTPNVTRQLSSNDQSSGCIITRTETSVSWYCDSNKYGQLNSETSTYCYCAIG